MKITNEMVEAAEHAYLDAQDPAEDYVEGLDPEVVEAMLKAALLADGTGNQACTCNAAGLLWKTHHEGCPADGAGEDQ